MTGGLADLFASERGWVFFILFTASTVLFVVGMMSIDQWIEFNKWLGIAILGSKTVTTSLETVANKKYGSISPPAGDPPKS